MIMTQEQKDNLFSPERNEQIEQSYRWPNRIVPYVMSKGHIKEQQDYIEQALKKFEQVTCIKFEPRTNEDDYIQITVSDQLKHSICCSYLLFYRPWVVAMRKLVTRKVHKS